MENSQFGRKLAGTFALSGSWTFGEVAFNLLYTHPQVAGSLSTFPGQETGVIGTAAMLGAVVGLLIHYLGLQKIRGEI